MPTGYPTAEETTFGEYTDEQLYTLGNNEAKAQLHRRYFRPLVLFVRGFSIGRAGGLDCEDIASEVLFRSLYGTANYTAQPNGSFKAWLFRIAVNEVLTQFRRPQFQRRVALNNVPRLQQGGEDAQSLVLDTTDLSPSPERLSHSQEILVAVNACEGTLPNAEHRVFLLWKEGFGAKEIAMLMNAKEGAVHTRLSRARARMKACLHEKGFM